MFDSFEDVIELYETLPETATVADIGGRGLTGSRRHVVLWHFVEHPAFACELRSKQPLTVETHDAIAEEANFDGDRPNSQ